MKRDTYLTHLECSQCGHSHPADVEQHLCAQCGGILLARYDLPRLANEVDRDSVQARSWASGVWRYSELLPVPDPNHRITLGEGLTPMFPVRWLSEELGAEVWLKDEGLNPTGTFKARGAAVGVSMARQLGATAIALPTAGNAGAAWAA